MNPGLLVLGLGGYFFFHFAFGIGFMGYVFICVFAELVHLAVVNHERREQSQ